MAVDVGTGTTITLATTGWTAELLDVGGPNPSRESIDTTHMGTTAPTGNEQGGRTFMPPRFQDPGELTLECHFDPDNPPPVNKAPEQCTVTFPTPAGKTTPATFVFTAFVTGWDPTTPLEDKMVANVTFKVSGVITPTASA